MPRVKEPLQAIDGEYYLVKSDVLAQTMMFSSSKDAMANLVTLPVERVREILAANRAGHKVESLPGADAEPRVEEPTYRTEEDSITRFDKAKKRKKRNRNKGGEKPQDGQGEKLQNAKPQGGQGEKPHGERPRHEEHGGQNHRRRDNRHRHRDNRPADKLPKSE